MNFKQAIYLDHAATTPLRSEVLEAMLPYLQDNYGNASSIHAFGRTARAGVTAARDLIADRLGIDPSELIFTSGGTESDNMAVIGAVRAFGADKRHIITTQIEHHAVLHACRHLEGEGYEVTYVPVDRAGQVHPDDIAKSIRPDTALISVMYGNNEVGSIQKIDMIGAIAREHGIVFHTDAVQALGAVPLHLSQLPVDLASFSAHKINGPKGAGALYVSRHTAISPYMFGGSQERGRRGGTENVAAIAGFAKAIEISMESAPIRQQNYEKFRTIMIDIWRSELGPQGFAENGHPAERLPHIMNVSFPGVDTETMLVNLDLEGVAAASGSACTSGSLERSHVLQAMGLPTEMTESAVRFSFGLGNDDDNIAAAARITAKIVQRIRNR